MCYDRLRTAVIACMMTAAERQTQKDYRQIFTFTVNPTIFVHDVWSRTERVEENFIRQSWWFGNAENNRTEPVFFPLLLSCPYTYVKISM